MVKPACSISWFYCIPCNSFNCKRSGQQRRRRGGCSGCVCKSILLPIRIQGECSTWLFRIAYNMSISKQENKRINIPFENAGQIPDSSKHLRELILEKERVTKLLYNAIEYSLTQETNSLFSRFTITKKALGRFQKSVVYLNQT